MYTGVVAALPEEVEVVLQRLEADERVESPDLDQALPIIRRGRLAGRPTAVAVTGDGERNAVRGVESFLSALPLRRLVAIGVGGGLAPDMEPCSVLLGREVWRARDEARLAPSRAELLWASGATGARTGLVVTVDELVDTPAAKTDLLEGISGGEADRPPAIADLESAFYAAAAEREGVPWLVFRAVSDGAEESLPSFLNQCRDEGGAVQRSDVVRHAFSHPNVLPDLVQLRRRVRCCAERLADCVERLLQKEEIAGEAAG